MEIPEGLETGGGNDLSVVVTVDESEWHLCTSEQTVSGTTGKEIFRKIQTVLFSFVVYLFERSMVWFSLLVLKMSSSVVVHTPKS